MGKLELQAFLSEEFSTHGGRLTEKQQLYPESLLFATQILERVPKEETQAFALESIKYILSAVLKIQGTRGGCDSSES